MRVICLFAATLAVVACGEGEPLDVLVEDTARYYNSQGEDFFADLYPGSKTGASAEGGDTLVVRIENIPSGKRATDPFKWSNGVREGMCASGGMDHLLEAGAKIRVEMRSNMGVELPTTHLASCVG